MIDELLGLIGQMKIQSSLEAGETWEAAKFRRSGYRVHRLWRRFGDRRVCLDDLVRLGSGDGQYCTELACSASLLLVGTLSLQTRRRWKGSPELIARLGAGSTFEIPNLDTRRLILPVGDLNLLVTIEADRVGGLPWPPHEPLGPAEAALLAARFREWLPH